MSRPLPPSSSRKRRFSFARSLLGAATVAALVACAAVAKADEARPAEAEGAAASPAAAPPADASPAGASPAGASPASASPAEPRDPSRTRRVELHYNPWIDGGVTLGLAAGVLSWGFIKADLPDRTCTICDGPGTEVNALDHAFRSALRRDDIGPSASMSHVISYGVSPAAGLALAVGVAAADRRASEAPANVLLVLEASLAAVVVKEAFTYAIRRERPEVHALSGEAKEAAMADQSDPMESFPSGHVLSIMAITSSSAVIATMRGYRLAPLIWIVGSTMAATVTYLRMASDQHYFTDNLIGGAIGTGIGAAIPLLFHRPVTPRDGGHAPGPSRAGLLRGATLTTTPVPGGRVVNVGWAF